MYKTKAYYSLIIFVAISFLPRLLLAQEEKSDCVLNLEQAQSKYDQGRIQDVEPLIGDCLQSKGFDKAAETQALKLLTLSYLFLEEPEKAEATMLELLSQNHLFVVNPAIDPSEFINLYKKFRTAPLYAFGLQAGGVAANPIVTQLNGTQDLNNDSRQFYTPQIKFRAGFNGEYQIKDKLFALGQFNLVSIRFKKSHKSITPYGLISETDQGFEGEETQLSIELPLILQYHILESKLLIPYVGLGVAPQLLISASYPGDALKNTVISSAAATANTISLTQDRNRFNISAVGIIGLKYKMGEGFLNAQIRYSYGLLNSSKQESGLNPQNANLLWDLNESSDVFKLQDLGFSIGYTRHIYKPKKLR